ncbi:MAG: M56 family metallopeptidase [Acidobacteriota bacterium]
MNELSALMMQLSATATGALVSAIWQGTLLAALVLIAVRLFPGLSAAARSIIWLNVFLLVAVLHLVPLAMQASAAAADHTFHLDPRWSLAVAAVWLALSLWRAGMLVAGALHLRGLARRAVPVAAAEVDDLLHTPGGKRVQLCASDEVARPSVLGFFRPRILVPPALLERLTAAELRQVVLHEMEHLRRHDDWTNLIQKIGLVLFPLNPALVWVEKQLCAERELACDDRVLHSGGGRKAYALCLTHLAEHGMLQRGYALVLGAWERRPELVRRVQRILSEPARAMGRKPALAVTGGLVVAALGCTVTLAHAPQIVSFAPAVEQARTLAPIDARELGLGGTERLVSATMPARPRTMVKPLHATKAVPAIQRHRVRRQPMPATRLAELRTPPQPMPEATIVMTQWSGAGLSQVTIAAVPVLELEPNGTVVRSAPQHRKAAAAFTMRTALAVVTPDGWFILQI